MTRSTSLANRLRRYRERHPRIDYYSAAWDILEHHLNDPNEIMEASL